MVDAHTGWTRMKHFNSSTCVTVHSLHRLLALLSASVLTAALSRNLFKQKIHLKFLTCINHFFEDNDGHNES